MGCPGFALFARHGFAQTSLKSLADAGGLSKAGLLHHFPSKEALYEAALEVGHARGERVLELLEPLPPGPVFRSLPVPLVTLTARLGVDPHFCGDGTYGFVSIARH